MGNSVLRGKGKISFPLDVAYSAPGQPDLHARLTSLSVRVQNAWRDRLDKSHRARELTVSWREYWLGHWTHAPRLTDGGRSQIRRRPSGTTGWPATS